MPDRQFVSHCSLIGPEQGHWLSAPVSAQATNGRSGADGRPWPSLREALTVWARVALLSFGGPAGQIAVMHRILVEEKRWLGEARFLHALNFCMLLPGPEAQQLATYTGWLMYGVRGGFMAGLLFVLPGAVAIMALSVVYALYGNVGAVAALFFGLKAAVLAIVVQAVVRIGSRALRNRAMLALAAASFIAIFFFAAPFPLIVLAAAVIGYAGGRSGLAAFAPDGGHGALGAQPVADAGTQVPGAPWNVDRQRQPFLDHDQGIGFPVVGGALGVLAGRDGQGQQDRPNEKLQRPFGAYRAIGHRCSLHEVAERPLEGLGPEIALPLGVFPVQPAQQEEVDVARRLEAVGGQGEGVLAANGLGQVGRHRDDEFSFTAGEFGAPEQGADHRNVLQERGSR